MAKMTEKMEEGMAKATKGFEKLTAFQKESLEALMAVADAAGKGMEKIQSEIATYTKSASEGL